MIRAVPTSDFWNALSKVLPNREQQNIILSIIESIDDDSMTINDFILQSKGRFNGVNFRCQYLMDRKGKKVEAPCGYRFIGLQLKMAPFPVNKMWVLVAADKTFVNRISTDGLYLVRLISECEYHKMKDTFGSVSSIQFPPLLDLIKSSS